MKKEIEDKIRQSHKNMANPQPKDESKDDEFMLDVPIKTPLWEDDESKEVKEGGEDWEIKPYRTVTGLKYSIVSHFDVIAKCDKEENAILLAQSNNMYDALKEARGVLILASVTDKTNTCEKMANKIYALLLKATPKK